MGKNYYELFLECSIMLFELLPALTQPKRRSEQKREFVGTPLNQDLRYMHKNKESRDI